MAKWNDDVTAAVDEVFAKWSATDPGIDLENMRHPDDGETGFSADQYDWLIAQPVREVPVGQRDEEEFQSLLELAESKEPVLGRREYWHWGIKKLKEARALVYGETYPKPVTYLSDILRNPHLRHCDRS